jgi:hypothetical protein
MGKKPIESINDDSGSDDDFEKVNKENVYKLESVDFRPICFVPPAAVPALATLDNPDFSCDA